jgi:hypothetical protein
MNDIVSGDSKLMYDVFMYDVLLSCLFDDLKI